MRNVFAEFAGLVTEHEPLAPWTSYGVGGPARWLARLRNREDRAALMGRARQEGIPVLPLGRGANLLVSDEGVGALVVRLNGTAFRQVDFPETVGDGLVPVRVGAGVELSRVVLESVRQGLGGLEVLAGIPGTLGGVLRMNAGGRWGCIGDVVRDVTVVDGDGAMRTLSAEQAGFAYRSSRLKGLLVCEATLELRPEDPERLRARYLEIMTAKKRVQPMNLPSAGCVFKNPPGQSAGRLIDEAGLKGRSVGGAMISELHGNFFVTQEGARAEDLFTLIDEVREVVADRFGCELELEIEVWGDRARQGAPVA